MAYFAAKAGDCTKPSVEIMATIITNFIPFLAILFVTFEYYRNLAPDCQIKKHCFHVKSTIHLRSTVVHHLLCMVLWVLNLILN
jgi:hypothetical protein